MPFGRLVVLERVGERGKQALWRCRCTCGNNIDIVGSSLKGGDTKSCGCLNSEVARKTRTRHSMFRTPEYATWAHMIQRCTNESDKSFRDYGGRGIKVCERWLESFENFFADMGARPEGMSLDRKNVNGGYELENCRWATKAEQMNNCRRNRLIEYDDITMTLQQWADKTGVKRGVIAWRLNNGWPVAKALGF